MPGRRRSYSIAGALRRAPSSPRASRGWKAGRPGHVRRDSPMTPRRTFAAGERDEAARERTSVATPTRTLVSLVWPFVATIALLLAIAAANLWTLSALRAYVNGEALWSKAQKEAVLHLEHYART